MDEIKVLAETVSYDKNAWYNTPDPDFLDICNKSRVQRNWLSYQAVLRSKYKDSILKPLSNYAQNLIPKPKLVSINDDLVTLRFYTFADIYVQWRDGHLYNVDRPWIRQYYTTANDIPVDDNVFEKTYKFYTPWFLDEKIEVLYSQVNDEYSAFVIHETKDMWHPVPKHLDFAYPHFVPFNFRKDGEHMKDENYGVIEWPHPMFDMSFSAHDIIVDNIRELYAKD